MTLVEIYNRFFLVNLNDFPNIGIDLEINKVLFCFLIGVIVTTVVFNYRTSINSAIIKKLIRYESNSKESAKTLDDLGLDKYSVRNTLSSSGGRLAKIVLRTDNTDNISAEGEEDKEADVSTGKSEITDDSKEKREELNADIKTIIESSEEKHEIATSEGETDTADADYELSKEKAEVGKVVDVDENNDSHKDNVKAPKFGRSKSKKKAELYEEKIDFKTAKFYLNPEKLADAQKIADNGGATVLNTILSCLLMVSFYVFIMFLMPSILSLINNFLG